MRPPRQIRLCAQWVAVAACWLAPLANAQDEPSTPAADSDVWSFETYEQLTDSVAQAEEALLLEDAGSTSWRVARQATLQTRRDLLEYVSRVLRAGNMPDDLQEDAERARYLLIQNVIAAAADLGQCDGLSVTLGLLQPVQGSDDEELALAWERAEADVQACVPWQDPQQTAATEGSSTVEPEPEFAEEAPPNRDRRTLRVAGQASVATGLVLLGSGLLWDWRSAETTRPDFELERDNCNASAPDCDYDRLLELKGTIDDSRAPILALSIGGAALTTAGLTMWLVDEFRHRDDSPAVTLAPGSTAGPLGMSVRWQF